ncbi:MAG: hypothetical protein GF400_00225 [Candidatus Eisenbacteria bacterium]|nr:hypothetical protein [Candidatus Eisenbacteria bacterium]
MDNGRVTVYGSALRNPSPGLGRTRENPSATPKRTRFSPLHPAASAIAIIGKTLQDGGDQVITRSALVSAFVALIALCVSPAGAQVFINEVMADPARDWSPSDGNDEYHSMEDEWVEIVNAGLDPVDITGWRLRDAVSDSSWRYEFTGTIQPGHLLVVFGNEAYHWEDQSGYPRQGLSLNNGGDVVTLVSADHETIIDQKEYGSSDVADDRSYGRLPDGGPDWAVFDQLNPLDPPETGLPPTPGAPNVGSPVESVHWGIIKSLYR